MSMEDVIGPHCAMASSGSYIDFADPKPEQINFGDIALGLSRECRFNGQTDFHYSVAQHSVLVSLMVPKEYALAALLHDATEAYMRDICSPLKSLIPEYKRIEDALQESIHERFGLPRVLDKEVQVAIKQADLRIGATEREQLLHADGRGWPSFHGVEPYPITIRRMDEETVYDYFTERMNSILQDRPFLAEIDLCAAQRNAGQDDLEDCYAQQALERVMRSAARMR